MKMFKSACLVALVAIIGVALFEQVAGQVVYQTPEDELVDLAINFRLTRLECVDLRGQVELKLTSAGLVPVPLQTQYISCMDYLNVLETSVKTVVVKMIELKPPMITFPTVIG